MSCSEKNSDAVARADRIEELVKRVALPRIEASGRLIEAEQQGPRAHRARDFKLALLAVGKLARDRIGARTKARPVEPFPRKLNRLLLGRLIAANAKESTKREARGAIERFMLSHH